MKISQSMIECFYHTANCLSVNQYRQYTFKFIKRNKELRLLKGNRVLASWFLETDKVINYKREKTEAEKQFVKKFLHLPYEAEKMYRNILERAEREKKEKEEEEAELQRQFHRELNEYCFKLKDEEFIEDLKDKIVSKFANRYVNVWYVVGVHPDRYDDNFGMYYSVARSRVHAALSHITEPRFQTLMNKLTPKIESIEEKVREKEKPKYTYIIPICAQREGNLVTITEIEQKRFEHLVNKAIKFAEDLVENKDPSCTVNDALTVYWWEKTGAFFLEEIPVVSRPKSTFRSLILNRLLPNPKKTPKPSRITLEVKLLPTDYITLTEHQYQKGIIKWNYELKHK